MPARAAAAARTMPDPADRIVRFFAKRLRHTKDRWAGRPFLLEPWQEHDIIRPLFGTVGRNGLRRYKEGLVGIARKNGKSETAAGIGLYGVFADGHYSPAGLWVPQIGAEVYVVAGSKPQARIIFDTARSMVLADPLLRAMSNVYKDAIEVTETNSIFRVLSADAKLAHGYNPSMAVIDELHVHPNSDLYDAMTTGTGARQQPLVLSITTAGWDRQTIAWRLYAAGKKRRNRGRFFFYWREAPMRPLTDTRAWKEGNPASWITQRYLREQLAAPGMTEFTFRRLHLNQWTSATERIIPMDKWDAPACKRKPVLPKGSEVVIAVDVAPRGHDRTSVMLIRRDEEGTYHLLARIFEVDPDIGIVSYDDIEDQVRVWAHEFDVLEVAYDPYYFDRSALDLGNEGLPMTEFRQDDARMIPASQSLFTAIMEGRIRHGGDATLREHAENAGAKETARGWRFHKPKSSGPIDTIITAAMGIDRWERGEAGQDEPRIWVGGR